MKRQRGVVLLVVLVVLVIVLLAGTSALRAVQTGNAVAGNYAFRQQAVHASDRAVNDAIAVIQNQVIGGNGNATQPNRYLSTISPAVNGLGIPTAIEWGEVECRDEKGGPVEDCNVDAGNFRVQYVVERRCSGDPAFADIKDIRSKCEYEPSATASSATTIALRYRILVRVRGPRGTESWFEAMVSGPATL